MKGIKKFCLIICVLLLVIMIGGCKKNKDYNEYYEFQVHVLSGNKTASFQDIKYKPENGAAFVPNTINGYTIIALGRPYNIGCTFRNTSVNRLYLPSTIKDVNDFVNVNIVSNLKIFMCNKAISIYALYVKIDYDDDDLIEIYVPSEYYDEYININGNEDNNIYKANVCYYLEDNEYYYVDYYENDSLIEYIPTNPEKKGFEFKGWYTEKECINEWDFESDKVQIDENNSELKLYAKWERKKWWF